MKNNLFTIFIDSSYIETTDNNDDDNITINEKDTHNDNNNIASAVTETPIRVNSDKTAVMIIKKLINSVAKKDSNHVNFKISGGLASYLPIYYEKESEWYERAYINLLREIENNQNCFFINQVLCLFCK